jgi:hypothetical protein
MKHHLQAILVVLAVLIAALGIVDLLTLLHWLPNFVVVWVNGIDAARQQLIHAQTPGEVLGALLYATALVALPCGYGVLIAIALLMIAARILGAGLAVILRFYLRKVTR